MYSIKNVVLIVRRFFCNINIIISTLNQLYNIYAQVFISSRVSQFKIMSVFIVMTIPFERFV